MFLLYTARLKHAFSYDPTVQSFRTLKIFKDDRDPSPRSGFQKKPRVGTSENHRGLYDATAFDIPHRWLSEKSFVLAIELAGAFVSNFKGRARGIKPVHEHAITGSMQAKLFLILKRAHRREGAK